MHRIGRTGRAGRTGIGITFVEAEQAKDVGRIAAALQLHGEFEGTGFAATHRPPARHGRPGAPPSPPPQGRGRGHAGQQRSTPLVRERARPRGAVEPRASPPSVLAPAFSDT